jgi:hypothetical protein
MTNSPDLQMPHLRPGFDIRTLAAKRRNKNNPWFKHGTLFTNTIDVLRRAQAPMTAREIPDVLLADKSPKATRKQAIGVRGNIFHAMRKRDGTMVVGVSAPARWRLKEPAN